MFEGVFQSESQHLQDILITFFFINPERQLEHFLNPLA